jgi:hypothetical protein
VCFFRDGDSWACVFGDFAGLGQSPAGHGAHVGQALYMLRQKTTRPIDFDYPLHEAAEALERAAESLDDDTLRSLATRCFSEPASCVA